MSHTDYSAIRYSRHVIILSYVLVLILVTMNLPIKAKSLSINTGGNLATVRGGAQWVESMWHGKQVMFTLQRLESDAVRSRNKIYCNWVFKRRLTLDMRNNSM